MKKEASTAGTRPSTQGAMTSAARKPSTTLGRLAMSSIEDFTRVLSGWRRNSLV